jgi:pseudaminic acid synthase
MSFKIFGKKVNKGSKPLIVAEISANHQKSLKTIFKIIDAAKNSGADAVKVQTYKADAMTLDISKNNFIVKNKKSKFYKKKLYDLYFDASLPFEWHSKIKNYAKKKKIYFFSSPFDKESSDFLHKLKVECFKIASFECTDLNLISHVAKKKKPMIISTGMASLDEIKEAVQTAKKNGCNNLILLKCTSGYPSKIRDANLASIPFLSKKFNCPVGLSDHTLGTVVPISSIAYGAVLIEKHIKLNDNASTPDSHFSLNPKQFKQMVKDVNQAYESKGKIFFGVSKSEKNSIKYRRSIIAIENINKDEKLTSKNIKVLRPSIGLEPKFLEQIIGYKVKKKIKIGDPIKFANIHK